MKKWNSPELAELSVSATAKTLQNGNQLDYASYDAVTGEIVKSYFASNEQPNYETVPDVDLTPVQ